MAPCLPVVNIHPLFRNKYREFLNSSHLATSDGQLGPRSTRSYFGVPVNCILTLSRTQRSVAEESPNLSQEHSGASMDSSLNYEFKEQAGRTTVTFLP